MSVTKNPDWYVWLRATARLVYRHKGFVGGACAVLFLLLVVSLASRPSAVLPPQQTASTAASAKTEAPLGKCSGLVILNAANPSKDFDYGNCLVGHTLIEGEFDVWVVNGYGVAQTGPIHVSVNNKLKGDPNVYIKRIQMTTPTGLYQTIECPLGSAPRDWKCLR